MPRPSVSQHALAAVFGLASIVGAGHCGVSTAVVDPWRDAGSVGDGGARDAGGSGHDAGATPPDAGAADGSVVPDCEPPDVVIALDRTLTMSRTATGAKPDDTPAGRATSKWAMAISGIEQLTAAPLDESIRFGLELWPRESTGCVTLSQRLNDVVATNPHCEGPDMAIEPALRTGASLSSRLDADTTVICNTTPTGAALVGAQSYLRQHQVKDRSQFVVLVTDGVDWDKTCPTPNPLDAVDALTDAGVATLIVGFGADADLAKGVGAAFLNDLACAGGMARDPKNSCVLTNGVMRAKDAGPDAGTLFYVANDTAALVTTLRTFAKTVCCGCIY